MGLVYDSPIEAIAVTAASDLWELLAPSDAAVKIHGFTVEQSSDTDSEQLRLTAKRVTGAPTSGSGGGTITPTPRVPGASAAGSTVERNNTTQITGGTQVALPDRSFNVLNGIEVIYDPPIEIAPSTRFVVGISLPGDSLTVSANLIHEEVGG